MSICTVARVCLLSDCNDKGQTFFHWKSVIMRLSLFDRGILRWTGTTLTMIIVFIWVLSYWCEFTLVFSNYSAGWIYSGAFRTVRAEFDVASEWGLTSGVRWRKYLESGFRRPEFEYRLSVTTSQVIQTNDMGPVFAQGVYSRGLWPLWVPFVTLALPTAWLWHRNRPRIPPGHCSCGYSFTGNTSGICPECGARIKCMYINGASVSDEIKGKQESKGTF